MIHNSEIIKVLKLEIYSLQDLVLEALLEGFEAGWSKDRTKEEFHKKFCEIQLNSTSFKKLLDIVNNRAWNSHNV